MGKILCMGHLVTGTVFQNYKLILVHRLPYGPPTTRDTIHNTSPSHVGRIQLVCSYPNNEMEDKVTIQEADQYYWLHSSVFSEDVAQMNRGVTL